MDGGGRGRVVLLGATASFTETFDRAPDEDRLMAAMFIILGQATVPGADSGGQFGRALLSAVVVFAAIGMLALAAPATHFSRQVRITAGWWISARAVSSLLS